MISFHHLFCEPWSFLLFNSLNHYRTQAKMKAATFHSNSLLTKTLLDNAVSLSYRNWTLNDKTEKLNLIFKVDNATKNK